MSVGSDTTLRQVDAETYNEYVRKLRSNAAIQETLSCGHGDCTHTVTITSGNLAGVTAAERTQVGSAVLYYIADKLA